ncbi:MAG: hypothetical protein ACI81T_002908, partial [Bacteroidia bacterium]
MLFSQTQALLHIRLNALLDSESQGTNKKPLQ